MSTTTIDNTFYNRVSSWIRSYRNPDALDWLRKFVDNSAEPAEIKLQLHREINYKEARLRRQHSFKQDGKNTYLMNEQGEVAVYKSRFSAICKIAELALKGYEVELESNLLFTRHRIKLAEPHVLNTATNTVILKRSSNGSK